MNKKLLLIYPPKIKMESAKASSDISLALLYLGGAAREICDSIKLFDMGLPKNDYTALKAIIEDFKPSIVGVNCLFSAIFPYVQQLAKYVKELDSSIKVVTGGIHPTIFSDEIIANCPEIDAVILGEGDLAFPNLLRYYYGDADMRELDSIVLRTEEDVTISLPKKSYCDDLDSLPMPAYELINFEDYRTDMSNWYNPNNVRLNGIAVPILTSRSCPNACNFCAMRLVMGRRLRTRSAESVFNEIKLLHDKYGITCFHIMDDNFTFDRQRTITICKLIVDSGINIMFDCPNGIMIRTLDDEVIEWLAKAGLSIAHIAVESGSESLRNNIMRKNASSDKILSVSKSLRKNNVVVMIFLLFGMPEESEITISETIDFLGKMEFDAYSLNILVPLPGTEIYKQVKQDNLFTDEISMDNQWNGDFIKQADPGNMAIQFFVKPYSIAVGDIKKQYVRLKSFLDEKCKAWIQHVNSKCPYNIT